MKQYRVTYTVDTGEGNDCILDANDPLNKLKEGMLLGTVPGMNTYLVYPEVQGEEDRKINPYGQV
jgi:hypothetical protein